MGPRQRRYFAGRAPGSEDGEEEDSRSSDASDESRTDNTSCSRLKKSITHPAPHDQRTKASSVRDAPVRRRPRIQAKVVTADAGTISEENARNYAAAKPLQQRGFVLVRDEEEGSGRRGGTGENLGQEKSSSEGSSSSDDSDSGSSSDSESHEAPANAHLRNHSPPRATPLQAPMFIPRAARVGIRNGASNSPLGKSQNKAKVAERRRASRKEEREQEARTNMLSDACENDVTDHDLHRVDMSTFPDDTDRPEDKEVEFALWRVRELKRIMRERGMDVNETGAEEESANAEEDSRVTKNSPNADDGRSHDANSGGGKGAYKVGGFFAERTPDGRYVEEVYNRNYGEEPESVLRKKRIQPTTAGWNIKEHRR